MAEENRSSCSSPPPRAQDEAPDETDVPCVTYEQKYDKYRKSDVFCQGRFEDGKFAKGSRTFPDSHNKYVRQIGDFSRTELNSLYGDCFIEFSSGDTFVGQIRDNRTNGHGVYTFKDRSMYIGNIKDGQFSGYGTLIDRKKSRIYTGEWENGMRNGKGTVTDIHSTTPIYIGQWLHNFYHGPGQLYMCGHLYFDGEFSRGKPNGTGTWIDENGSPVFTGTWVNGYPRPWGSEDGLEFKASDDPVEYGEFDFQRVSSVDKDGLTVFKGFQNSQGELTHIARCLLEDGKWCDIVFDRGVIIRMALSHQDS